MLDFSLAFKKVVLTGISSANVEDGEGGLDVLCDDILDSTVALIPVKGFLILLITVLPVLGFSVLCHF